MLVTLHRPALVDNLELLGRTIGALEEVSRAFPVVFPMHPRTKARIEEAGIEVPGRVHITPPLSYTTFLSLELGAAAVATDSGGVQEETTALGVPCFTLRDNTERPVTVTDGTNVVLGLDPSRLAEIPSLLNGPRVARRPHAVGRSGREAGSIRDRAHARRRARTVRLALSGAHPLRRRLSSPAACAGRRCRAVGTRSCRRG